MQIQIILYVSDLKALFKQQKRSAFFMQNNFRTIKNKTKNFTIIDSILGSIPKDISNYLEMSFFAFVKGH